MFNLSSCREEVHNKHRIDFDGHIYINCLVNDTIEAKFILDTGCPVFVLDSTFNSKYKIITDKSDNEKLISVKKGEKIHVKFDTIDQYPSYLLIRNLKKETNYKCDGVLDWRMFKNSALQLSLSDSFLVVLNPRKFIVDSYEVISLINDNIHLQIPIELEAFNGRVVNKNFIFDTGYPNGLMVNGPAFNFMDSTIQIKYWMYTNLIFDSKVRSNYYFCKGKSFSIGGYRINEPLIDRVFNLDSGKSTKFSGLVGNLILKKFDAIIDFKNSKLYLKPNSFFKEEMKVVSFGFGITHNGQTGRVNCVIKGSKAYESGLLFDDEIVEIQGKPFGDYNKYDLKKLYSKEGLNFEFVFKRKDSLFKLTIPNQRYL